MGSMAAALLLLPPPPRKPLPSFIPREGGPGRRRGPEGLRDPPPARRTPLAASLAGARSGAGSRGGPAAAARAHRRHPHPRRRAAPGPGCTYGSRRRLQLKITPRPLHNGISSPCAPHCTCAARGTLGTARPAGQPAGGQRAGATAPARRSFRVARGGRRRRGPGPGPPRTVPRRARGGGGSGTARRLGPAPAGAPGSASAVCGAGETVANTRSGLAAALLRIAQATSFLPSKSAAAYRAGLRGGQGALLAPPAS